jgi:hypothetical protein
MMADPFCPTPTVLTTGRRCSIQIPAAHAAALLAYLRQKGICSDTPQPSSTGMKCIALHRGADVEKVQALLDAWAPSLATDT